MPITSVRNHPSMARMQPAAPEDFANDPVIRRNPRLLPVTLKSFSEDELRRHRPQLFCHPREARADVEWGRAELGEANKVSPREMRALFEWSARARMTRKLKAKTPNASNIGPACFRSRHIASSTARCRKCSAVGHAQVSAHHRNLARPFL